MKKVILLLAVVFSVNVSAQSWSYRSGGNVFDGEYKVASVKGTGNDYPYDSPTLYVRIMADGDLDIFINGVGYVTDETILTIAFDGEVKYRDNGALPSGDNEAVFISFSDVKTSELIEDMKSASTMSVRFSASHGGKNDMKFSLSGSTRALQQTLGSDYTESVRQVDSLGRVNLGNLLRADSAWSLFISDDVVNAMADELGHGVFFKGISTSDIHTIEITSPYRDAYYIIINGENAYIRWGFSKESIRYTINGEYYNGKPLVRNSPTR